MLSAIMLKQLYDNTACLLRLTTQQFSIFIVRHQIRDPRMSAKWIDSTIGYGLLTALQ